MEDVRLFPEVVKEEKKSLITDKCHNCGDMDVIPVSDYEHSFEDNINKNDGVLCNTCGCFHYMTGEGLTYEYLYTDIISSSDKVDWKISDN